MFDLRLATDEDVEVVLRMARQFHNTLPFSKLVAFDEDSVVALIFKALDEGVIVVTTDAFKEVVGCIGLLFHPALMNQNVMQATEIMWWMDEECRGTAAGRAMYLAAELCAKEEGCKLMTMIAMETSPRGTDAFYRRQKYVKTESAYVKVL